MIPCIAACYCQFEDILVTATAITDGGDAVWNVNPSALLMNDVAVASLPFGIAGNSKVMSMCASIHWTVYYEC